MADLIVNPKHLARKTDPVTSHMAAKQVVLFSDTHRGMIHAALKAYGPMHVDQIAFVTDLPSQAVNKRLPELQRLGVANPLDGVLRPSDSGRMARVWSAA
jgi:predicted ArsR family transcriptional regulator